MGKRKFKRLENGFGSVVYLGEGRRKPFAARLSASHTATGQNTPKAIGYYETWQQAYDALAEHHKKPALADTTFSEMYEMLVKRKRMSPKGLSTALANNFRAAYKHSSDLWDRPMSSIRTGDMQFLLDRKTESLSGAYLEQIKNLWNQMFAMAYEYDIIEKNYASFVRVNKLSDCVHSVPFTRAEVDQMWQHSEDPDVVRLLVMIYSGFRVSEYSVIDIDLAQMTLSGGLKTQAGKNRVVPIHSRIQSLIKRLRAEDDILFRDARTVRARMRPTLDRIGIQPGTHTPHDTRATFASLCEASGVPELHIKRMLGHATGDITKDIYTTVYIDQLRKSIEMIT